MKGCTKSNAVSQGWWLEFRCGSTRFNLSSLSLLDSRKLSMLAICPLSLLHKKSLLFSLASSLSQFWGSQFSYGIRLGGIQESFFCK